MTCVLLAEILNAVAHSRSIWKGQQHPVSLHAAAC